MRIDSKIKKYMSISSMQKLNLPEETIQGIEDGNLSIQDEKLIIIAMSQMMEDEENFELELDQFNSFYEMKGAADERQKTTGIFYYDLILQKNITYRDASADEIEELFIAGATLPDNAIFSMVSMNNVDLAIDLHERGIPVNVDYVDNFTGMTPIEFLINLYSIHPDQSPSIISNDITKLINIGLPLKIDDGTRDPLDLALSGAKSYDPLSAEKLMELAVKLNHMGIYLEDSHQEALREISQLHPKIYNKYSEDFK